MEHPDHGSGVGDGLADDARRTRAWPLIAVGVTLYLCLACLYLFAVPTGESPDEPGHLQCIEQVAVGDQLPRVDPKPSGEWWKPGVVLSGRMCYHMPLYYLSAGYAQRFLAGVTGTATAFEFPPHNEQFGATPAMFVHSDKDHFWQLSEPPILVGLRILSILLGLVTLAAAYVAARFLFPRYEAAPLAMTVVAGWPQFVYMSRSINNDMLATALGAGLLIILLFVGRPVRFLFAALLAGLAALTKLTMSFALAVVVVVWLVETLAFVSLRRRYALVLPAMGFIWLLLFAPLSRHPTMIENLAISRRYAGRVAEGVGSPDYWLAVLRLTLDSGWARLGWMNVAAPVWQSTLWWGIIILAVGAGIIAWRGQKHDRRQKIVSLVLAVWMVGLLVSYIRINATWFQPQFRFLFGALPILASVASGGIMRLLERYRGVSSTAIVSAAALILLAVNLWIVFGLLGPAYR